MKKQNVLLLIITAFLFSGCADRLALEIERTTEEVLRDLELTEATNRCNYINIPIQKIPKSRSCPKRMNIEQCLIFQSNNTKKLRRKFKLQVQACETINKEYSHDL